MRVKGEVCPSLGKDLEEATASRSGELNRNVDTTQETAEVSGKSNDHGGQELQRQAVTRKRRT